MTALYPENTYSFCYDWLLRDWKADLANSGASQGDADQAAMEAQPLSDVWVQANVAFRAGRYGDATDAYRGVVASAFALAAQAPGMFLGGEVKDFALEIAGLAALGQAESLHALGSYAASEAAYTQAAGLPPTLGFTPPDASFASFLWIRLATLYHEWGDALFRDDLPAGALPIYGKVLLVDATTPSDSVLYTAPALAAPAGLARAIAADIAQHGPSGPGKSRMEFNPLQVAALLQVYQQLLKINNGLDFWGHRQTSVPIWTFEYLQSAALTFAQQAVNAERDFIGFRERADQGNLTRQQLVQSVVQSQAEVGAAQLQLAASVAETAAYQDAAALAQQRAADAKANATEYAATSALAIQCEAVAGQLAGGDDGDYTRVNQLADDLLAGKSLEDDNATLSAATQLAGGRLNRQYEVDSLNRQGTEMATAQAAAADEAKAAAARQAVAEAGVAIAQLQSAGASQNLLAFDAQFFTPDVWGRMSDAMWRIYRRYLVMALQTARLMQRAYNFETDQQLDLIRSDYSSSEVQGMLGAEALMADIESFTYNLITSHASKPQAVRQTVSLADRYGFAFERQLRATGVMEFETRIDDFDALYPGTYAARIESVEVDVVGIVPPAGLSGTLTNGGISLYRVPASASTTGASGAATTVLKQRIQPKETLVLSDFNRRQDIALAPDDPRMSRIFEGAGVASTWRLEIPKAVNDIDYAALTDVRLTFTYKARFDPDLKAQVLAELAGRPGVDGRHRAIPLRWMYPEAFFRFQRTGTLSLSLAPRDFPSNETNPTLTDIAVVVTTDGTVPAKGLTLTLATPAHVAVPAVADEAGIIDSGRTSSPWAALASGTVLGAYELVVPSASNPQLGKDGQFSLAPIVNLALVVAYSFTPKA